MVATVEKAGKRKDDPDQKSLVDTDGEIRDDVPAKLVEEVNRYLKYKALAKENRELAKQLKNDLVNVIEEVCDPNVTYFVPKDETDEVYRVYIETSRSASVQKTKGEDN